MPTQKIFKQRIRARMTKTGESYTAARHQLLRKGTVPVEPAEPRNGATGPAELAPTATAARTPTREVVPPEAMGVPDDSMERATGKRHAEWFAILDAWGATDHTHTEIARWLSGTHGVPGWWVQSVTVAYERARGMRVTHQMRDGFSVSATRTVAADPQLALAAFTSEPTRRRWLPDAEMRRRATRAARTARFDWPDPGSRVVVTVSPKGDRKTAVNVVHDQIPDAAAAGRLKAMWRERLGALKEVVEQV